MGFCVFWSSVPTVSGASLFVIWPNTNGAPSTLNTLTSLVVSDDGPREGINALKWFAFASSRSACVEILSKKNLLLRNYYNN